MLTTWLHLNSHFLKDSLKLFHELSLVELSAVKESYRLAIWPSAFQKDNFSATSTSYEEQFIVVLRPSFSIKKKVGHINAT